MRARCARQFFLAGLCCAICSCDREPVARATRRPAEHARPSVVSLVPAATDLLFGMGAGEHLAGVSTWDSPRPEIAGLPRVGDYYTVDWEKIAELRPNVMIVQFAPDKMPPGLSQRAESLGINLVNVRINRLDEVFETMRVLGVVVGESSKATDAQKRLREQLDAVRQRVAGRPPVRTLIARTESSLAVVGGGNFMDDVLTVAGGRNVIEGGDNSYPTIDRERLLELNPEVILQVLPGATPQEIERAESFWKQVPQVAAARNRRVHLLTESYLLLPGFSVGKMAELFASKLHPEAESKGRP